jgi:3-methyladenine DNA glycosylase/8-oxoguanine DNA glycosylase
LWNGTETDLARVAAVVKKMLDLDARTDVLREAMNRDKSLSIIWDRYPGLRVVRAWSPIESLFSTILGQVVSVVFGRVLIGELMRAAGSEASHPKTSQKIHLFPTAKQIIAADLSLVRTSEARRLTIRSLGYAIENGTLDLRSLMPPQARKKSLLSIPGLGPWTAEYVAMRGFEDNDAFPATDYVLKQELRRHPTIDIEQARPFRAYAATALWRNFVEGKNINPMGQQFEK